MSKSRTSPTSPRTVSPTGAELKAGQRVCSKGIANETTARVSRRVMRTAQDQSHQSRRSTARMRSPNLLCSNPGCLAISEVSGRPGLVGETAWMLSDAVTEEVPMPSRFIPLLPFADAMELHTLWRFFPTAVQAALDTSEKSSLRMARSRSFYRRLLLATVEVRDGTTTVPWLAGKRLLGKPPPFDLSEPK